MNGGGGDAPPGASGGEFLLSLLQKHQQQRQHQAPPQQQQQQQQPQQILSLDPAVAAVGPTVPFLPPWSSNGRDLASHRWPHNNSPPLPPHFLGLPQNHWLPGNQSISGEDFQRLGFPVINSNRTVHNPVQQEQKNLVFGTFNNSATATKEREVSLGNGFDRNQNRRFNSNSTNSNSNSTNSNPNPNYGISDSREKEWRGKQHNIGNYRSTPSQETRRRPPPPPPPGFSAGRNWDYGNRRKGIEHNEDKEKGIYSDEDVSNVKFRVGRMVDHPGPAARSIVHSHSPAALDVEESVMGLHIDDDDAENEDDFGHQLVDSLLHEDDSHDKKDKKQQRNFHDKEARSDDRGRRLLSQRIRIMKRQMECRVDIDRLKAPFLAICETLIPPEEEKAMQKQLLTFLQKLVTKEWPKARLFLYGSCANSFGVSKSDIDVCLAIDDTDVEKSEILEKLAESFQSNGLQNVQVLARARVPIVKLMDPKTGISCDICINNVLAVVNTKLLRDYAQIDMRLRQLAFIVKHWAKSRGVNETYRGTLSSYAYVLMCIHFLQQRRPAILPCLQEMETTYSVTVDNIECAFYDEVEQLRNFGSHNKETIAQLVWAFFNYWAYRHDYANDVISVRTGSIISKREKDWTRRIGNDRHLICIEDPFEISHDLGRVVDKYSIKVLREEFERAADILQYSPNPSVALFEPYVPIS